MAAQTEKDSTDVEKKIQNYVATSSQINKNLVKISSYLVWASSPAYI